MYSKSIFIFLFYWLEFGDGSANKFNNHFGISNFFLNQKFYAKNTNTTRIDLSSRSKNAEICFEQITEITNGILNRQQWALEFIDSWGKIPSGILYGHFREFGNYEECINAKRLTPGKYELIGKYCTARIQIKNLIEIIPDGNSKDNSDNSLLSTYLNIGICVPNICDPDIINEQLKQILMYSLKIKFDEDYEILKSTSCISISSNKVIFEPIEIAAIIVFSTVGLMILISTTYDIFSTHIQKKPIALLTAFSLVTNGIKLFQISTEKSNTVVGCLNGIRSLSIIWIIVSHRYALSVTLPFINVTEGRKWYSTLFSLMIQNASVAVDSFFFLSGFLIAWLGFKELQKSNGKINIPIMYFHRFMRLTPVLCFVVLFVASLLRFVGSGPLWNGYIEGFQNLCIENWWQTLLYIQNYVNPDKICLYHTWYLAVDTQLFILSPLFLILTQKWGSKFLYPSAMILIFASIAYTFGTYINYGFSMVKSQQNETIENYRNEVIYFPTHTRISPWLIGLCLGYYMFKSQNKKITIPKCIVLACWSFIFITLVSVLFGTYSKIQPNAISNPIEEAFYESLCRIAWSLILSWIVFACHNGYGTIFISPFLSHPFWAILGRLTYSIYLLHAIILEINISSVKTSLHFSNYETHLAFWGDLGVTLLSAILVALSFESPFIALEKNIFNRIKTT